MSPPRTELLEKVASLRAEFDRSFAAPLPARAANRAGLLAIRVGGEPFALRLEHLAGVSLGRKLVPLAGSVPQLAGLVGVRGRLVAVYRLASLVGGGAQAGPEPWVAQSVRDPSVGLCFGDLEGFLEVEPASVHRVASDQGLPGHVQECIRDGSTVRPLVNLPSVLTAIERLARAGRPA